MPEPEPTVFIMVNGNQTPMRTITSQTEEKKGWDIQGITVGKKLIRYFWGKQSKQLTDQKPCFVIYPKECTLNDYALIRLNKRRDHRRLPYAELNECGYTRINIDSFVIENLPDMGFSVRPKEDLFPGEYILVNLKQTPCNESGDIVAYDFSVPGK
ncbi:MAG: hypothetical protein H9789_07935 [Candidatus Paraprevotella stercoravium]|nr:hypothetical protein [Candidatus Paraprevotella stercoravium]